MPKGNSDETDLVQLCAFFRGPTNRGANRNHNNHTHTQECLDLRVLK